MRASSAAKMKMVLVATEILSSIGKLHAVIILGQISPISHFPMALERSDGNEEGKKCTDRRLCIVADNCVAFLLRAPSAKLERRLTSAMAVRVVVDEVEESLEHAPPDHQRHVVTALANHQLRFFFCLPLPQSRVYTFLRCLCRCARNSGAAHSYRAVLLRARALACTGGRLKGCTRLLERAACHEAAASAFSHDAKHILNVMRALEQEDSPLLQNTLNELTRDEGDVAACAEALAAVALGDVALMMRRRRRHRYLSTANGYSGAPLLDESGLLVDKATSRGKQYVSERLGEAHPLLHLFNAVEKLSKQKHRRSARPSAFEIFKRLWTRAHTLAAETARKHAGEDPHLLRFLENWIYSSAGNDVTDTEEEESHTDPLAPADNGAAVPLER